MAGLLTFDEPDGIESEAVDGLTGTIGEEKSLPTLEGEEDKKGKVVAKFSGVADVVKETKVVVGAEGIVVVGQYVCEGEGDVATGDDFLCLARLVSHQQEGEDDTAKEDPLSGFKRDEDTAFDGCTLLEDFV